MHPAIVVIVTGFFYKKYFLERQRERERREERGREDAETFMCTHICAAGPLILSRHPPVKWWESTVGVPSAKFRGLNTEQRVKGRRCDRQVAGTRWKGFFLIMINRSFVRLLMMRVFSRVCSGVLWGMRESAVSDSGRGHWFFFWVLCLILYKQSL